MFYFNLKYLHVVMYIDVCYMLKISVKTLTTLLVKDGRRLVEVFDPLLFVKFEISIFPIKGATLILEDCEERRHDEEHRKTGRKMEN